MRDESNNGNPDPESLAGPVLCYNEVVIDHFMNPRNVGELIPLRSGGHRLEAWQEHPRSSS